MAEHQVKEIEDVKEVEEKARAGGPVRNRIESGLCEVGNDATQFMEGMAEDMKGGFSSTSLTSSTSSTSSR